MSWIKPNWAVSLYELFGKKLQDYYDAIDDWEWSPEVKEAIQTLSDAIPASVAVPLVKYITQKYKEVGPKAAEEWVRQLLKVLNNFSFGG